MNIVLPDNWNQVSVGQFMEISKINDIDENLIDFISILSKTSVEEVEKWNRETINKIILELQWAFKMPDETAYNTDISVGKSDYILIELSALSVKEWIELIFYIKEYNKNLDKIFSILYKPVSEINKSIKSEMMIGDVYGALVFFCHIEREYLKSIQPCLLSQVQMTTMMKEPKKKKMMIKEKKKLTLIFLGMSLFTLLLMVIF